MPTEKEHPNPSLPLYFSPPTEQMKRVLDSHYLEWSGVIVTGLTFLYSFRLMKPLGDIFCYKDRHPFSLVRCYYTYVAACITYLELQNHCFF